MTSIIIICLMATCLLGGYVMGNKNLFKSKSATDNQWRLTNEETMKAAAVFCYWLLIQKSCDYKNKIDLESLLPHINSPESQAWCWCELTRNPTKYQDIDEAIKMIQSAYAAPVIPIEYERWEHVKKEIDRLTACFFDASAALTRYNYFHKEIWRQIPEHAKDDAAEVNTAYIANRLLTDGIGYFRPTGSAWGKPCTRREAEEYQEPFADIWEDFRKWCGTQR